MTARLSTTFKADGKGNGDGDDDDADDDADNDDDDGSDVAKHRNDRQARK